MTAGQMSWPEDPLTNLPLKDFGDEQVHNHDWWKKKKHHYFHFRLTIILTIRCNLIHTTSL